MPAYSLLPVSGRPFADRAPRYDVVVVGAGIIGLSHAYDAYSRGLSVAVVDRGAGIGGASVRNFGHIGVTAQSGRALGYASASRELWLDMAEDADFWISDAGSIIVARSAAELAVLEEFHAERGTGDVVLLSRARVKECSPVVDPGVVGGAWFPRDLQVDPRTAAPRIADWLAEEGVHFFWETAVTGVDDAAVVTPRGELHADTIIVAVNHDVDTLFPEVADAAGVVRCSLDMVSVRADLVRDLAGPILTGFSMVRYSGLAGLPSAQAVRDELRVTHPDLVTLDVNQMYAQRSNGELIVGDTNTLANAVSPFQPETSFDALLGLTRELFGTELEVTGRWQGIYAKGREDYLVSSPGPATTVVSVTTGIGMSTGPGLAAAVMSERFGAVVAA